jgi:hypothetical protein
VNALGDERVVDYVNENFVSTYLKVGTFQVINGQKVGGNVASYFCLGDGSVLHAVPGQVNADKFLNEARWAFEVRKSALTFSTDLVEGKVDARKYRDIVKKAHVERFNVETGHRFNHRQTLPVSLPRNVGQQAQAHWLLASRPMARIDDVYPTVWTQVLREQLSTLPVEKR